MVGYLHQHELFQGVHVVSRTISCSGHRRRSFPLSFPSPGPSTTIGIVPLFPQVTMSPSRRPLRSTTCRAAISRGRVVHSLSHETLRPELRGTFTQMPSHITPSSVPSICQSTWSISVRCVTGGGRPTTSCGTSRGSAA